MFRKISLGRIGLSVGGVLTLVGFVAYAQENATLNLAGFFYGIPLLLGGLALTASELKPVPYTKQTTPEVLKLREQQATDTQNQVRKDVTRYRYGQEAHLDESLERLGLSPTDEDRPILQGLHEKATDGNYTLVLEFYSPFFSLADWQEKREKIEKFFGPGIQVEVMQPEEDFVDVAMVANG